MPLDIDGREIHVGDYVERACDPKYDRWHEHSVVIEYGYQPGQMFVVSVAHSTSCFLGIENEQEEHWWANGFRVVNRPPSTVRDMSRKVYREYMKCPT